MTIQAPGRLPISLHLLRMVLDLPKGLRIIGVRDLPGEGAIELLVRGAGIPDDAKLCAIYAEVKPTQARLERLDVEPAEVDRELLRLEGMVADV